MEKHTFKRIKASDKIEIDKFSNLPDSTIHHILSLMEGEYAVQTSILSKLWRFQWAHVSTYSLNPSNSSGDADFPHFVANLFTNRKRFNVSRPMFRVSGIKMSNLVKLFYLYFLLCREEEFDIRNMVQVEDQMVVDRISRLPDSVRHNILSLADTKNVVQTSVLSKRWRNDWKNIHSLSFDRGSFNSWPAFEKFVNVALGLLQPISLEKLQVISGGKFREKLMKQVLDYTEYHHPDVLEIDVIPPPWEEDPHFTNQEFVFENVRMLRISDAIIRPKCSNIRVPHLASVDHLQFVNCSLHSSLQTVRIYISRPKILTISNFEYCGNMEINSGSLHTFNWKGKYPCYFSFRAETPSEVNIHISPPEDFQTQKWCAAMGIMVGDCSHAKSITVVLNLSQGKFVMYYKRLNHSEIQTKIVEVHKETKEENVWAYGFELHEFGSILLRILDEKRRTNEMDRLTTLKDHLIHHILSFMDTKTAVSTSVLSKEWRYHWTHTHDLDLEWRFYTITDFKNFVLRIFKERGSLKLNKLRFHLLGGARNQVVAKIVLDYAIANGVEELDAYMTKFPTNFFSECHTLTTLTLNRWSNDLPNLGRLTLLTTLELKDVRLDNGDFFSTCSALKTLSLTKCRVATAISLGIPAPKLVTLVISDLKFYTVKSSSELRDPAPSNRKTAIAAPSVKVLVLKGVNPSKLGVEGCPSLENVDIQLRVPYQICGEKKQTFVLDMFSMVEGFLHFNTLRISLDTAKELFVLQHASEGGSKISVLNKKTGITQIDGLATMMKEI